MKKLLILLLLLPTISFAQKKKKISANKQARIDAVAHIQQLKESVLLVRLSAKKNTINAMKKAGKDKLSLKTEKKQNERNLQIIAAFRANFNFCKKVYFFYSEDSDYIRNNQLDSVSFLSDNLKIDNTLKLENSSYYTAELGIVNSNTENTANEISITGLIIKDSELVQLPKPFPYYVREFKGLPFQRAIFKVVLKMNTVLMEYYNENK